MKFALAALVLVASVALTSGNVFKSVDFGPGYHFQHRPRVGHFAAEPNQDLYRSYVKVFIHPNHKEREDDDFRNYSPAAEDCIPFFETFIAYDYTVQKVEHLVPLDACLAYLFDKEMQEFHEGDKQENDYVATHLETYVNDEKLKAIYEGTKFDGESKEAKECVGKLLLQSIAIKEEFPDVECNNHIIQIFNTFGECHTSITQELRTSQSKDTYFKMIYDLLAARGKECFDAELRATNMAVRSGYKNSLFFRASNPIKAKVFGNKHSKQAESRKWPRELVDVFVAFQGAKPKHQLNTRQGMISIRGFYLNDEKQTENLLNNLAKYADYKIDPNSRFHKDANAADPSGSKRYRDLIDDLCMYFRINDDPNMYDYATSFARLARMVDFHEEIFTGLSPNQFIKEVYNSAHETAPLYVAVVSCHIMDFTQGALVSPRHNGKSHYKVTVVPNTSALIRWPVPETY